jgi:hypothetical protein
LIFVRSEKPGIASFTPDAASWSQQVENSIISAH